MTITPGTRLGPYEIVAPIGAGGMGEVYKARDTRLDRAVAVKILPAEFAQNAQLKVRFEREARTISQLSHPNICALYDVGENYIVMELLDGQSLADRLTKGPLPLRETLKYGVQIAEALGKAHREGIVHRDLKPGNVMITKSGAKLLDFGLAKSMAAGFSPPDVATIQKPLTQEGTVLGTYQYMAPEQIAGEEPDARTDIFAFGAVLYEMGTGKPAFEGKTKTSLVAAIVSGEPRPMSELQPLTPPALEHVVRKCLAKDGDDRWQSASDVAEELRWISEVGSQAGVAKVSIPRRRLREWFAWSIALVSVAVVTYSSLRPKEAQRPDAVIRTAIPLPAGTTVNLIGDPILAISPDARAIVYAAPDRGTPRLWVRYLDRLNGSPLIGTDGAQQPFFSPDGDWIGFVANGLLKKIPTSGGAAQVLCPITVGFRGASWGRDGNIYFVPSRATGVWSVPANGGKPAVVSHPDVSRDEISHRWPQLLPDGKHILITIKTAQIATFDAGRVAVLSRTDGSVHTVIEGGTYGRYIPSGHLVFARGNSLYAVPFDLKRMSVGGAPLAILDDLFVSPTYGSAQFAFAENGALVYLSSVVRPANALIWLDQKGQSTSVSTGDRILIQPRVSPDGRRIAVNIQGANDDIGILDPARGTLTRLSFEPGNEHSPVWTPDGLRIIYASEISGGSDQSRVLIKNVDGSGNSEELFRSSSVVTPSSVSPDGTLAYVDFDRSTGTDIWLYSIAKGSRTALIRTPFNELDPQFSPNGKWLAYLSNESGRAEIYVRPVTQGSGRWQVSTEGGVGPRWSRDGTTLYYWNPNYFYSVKVVANGEVPFAKPQQLVATRYQGSQAYSPDQTQNLQYDIDPDGRFVMTLASQGVPVSELTFVVNWFDDVRRRSPLTK